MIRLHEPFKEKLQLELFNMLDNFIKKFTNCYILRNNEIIKEDLWVRGGKIINPEPLFFEEKIGPSEVIDCNGALIAPGLIDLQINGGFGVDFSKDMKDEESVRECIRTVARKLLAHGNKLTSILNVCWSDEFLVKIFHL